MGITIKRTDGLVVGTAPEGVVLRVPRRGDWQMTPEQARALAAALLKHAEEVANG